MANTISPLSTDFTTQSLIDTATAQLKPTTQAKTQSLRLLRLIGSLAASLLGGLALLMLMVLSTPSQIAHAGPPPADACFATIDATTIYSSSDNTALQLAANSAVNGDVIKVAGTCAGISMTDGMSQVVYIAATNVTVRGGYTTTDWATSNPSTNPTVLDALGAGRGVVITSSTGTLENLIVQNGSAFQGRQAQCVLSSICGGGIYARYDLSAKGVQVQSNLAEIGAGMYISGVLMMSNSVISNNVATHGGGAMVMTYANIKASQFISNAAGVGAGLYLLMSAGGEVDSSSFMQNQGALGGGLIHYPEGSLTPSQALVFTNTDFISNTGGGLGTIGEVWVSGGSFISNTSSASGAAIFQQSLTGPSHMVPIHITGTRFLHNVATTAGAINVIGQADITNAYFEDNRATSGNGGAIVSNWYGPGTQKPITIRGSTFISNSTNAYGGVMVTNGRIDIADSSFMQNFAQYGGAIYQFFVTSFGEPIAVSQSDFVSNTSLTTGGAIVSSGDVSVVGGSFISNTASGGGGAIYLTPVGPTPSIADISGTTFSRNVVLVGDGGALNVGGKLLMRNSTLTNNSAAANGGAVFQRTASPVYYLLQLQNVLVADNRALSNGGGVFASGQLDISNSQFARNSVTSGNGGGVYLSAPASIFSATPQRVVSTDFISNTAVTGAGLLGLTSFGPNVPDLFEVRDSRFLSNNAVTVGGALALVNFAPNISDNDIVNNSATTGGGLAVSYLGPSYYGTLFTLERNHIMSNTAANIGGGLWVNSSAPILTQGNVWQYNYADNEGGAIFMQQGMGSRLLQEAIYDNVAGNNGGGIYFSQTGNCVTLENSILAANSVLTTSVAASDIGLGGPSYSCLIGKHNTFAAASAGSDTAIVVGVDVVGDSAALTNTIFNGYSVALQMGPFTSTIVADHALFDGVTAQANGSNITVTNALSGSASFVNPAQRNYHLLSSSAAIDAGAAIDTLTDFDGDTRPQASGMDLGADEADVLIAGLSAINSSPTRLSDSTVFTASVLAGTNVSYVWDFGDASATAAGANITHVYSSVGVYTATVVASNNANVLSATMRVTVTNAQPIANAGPDQSVSLGGQVVVAGVLSSDPDGHIPLSYEWVQTSGPVVSLSGANSSVLSFTAPNSAGTLNFSLVVTDAQGLASVADGIVVTVRDIGITGLSASNSSPTLLGSATTFTASITAGSAVSYTWYFGDGATGSGITATHTYTATGSYVAYVEATNSNGSVVAQTVAVVITNQQRIYLPQVQR